MGVVAFSWEANKGGKAALPLLSGVLVIFWWFIFTEATASESDLPVSVVELNPFDSYTDGALYLWTLHRCVMVVLFITTFIFFHPIFLQLVFLLMLIWLCFMLHFHFFVANTYFYVIDVLDRTWKMVHSLFVAWWNQKMWRRKRGGRRSSLIIQIRSKRKMPPPKRRVVGSTLLQSASPNVDSVLYYWYTLISSVFFYCINKSVRSVWLK